MRTVAAQQTAQGSLEIKMPTTGVLSRIYMELVGGNASGIARPRAAVALQPKSATDLANPSGNDYLTFLEYNFQFDSAAGRTLGWIAQMFPVMMNVTINQSLYLCMDQAAGVTVKCLIYIQEEGDGSFLRNLGHVAQVTKKTRPRISEVLIDHKKIRALGSRVMTGYEAWECCGDMVAAVIDAAQVITENGVWWLTGLDLLQTNVEISASELVALLGVWSTSGAIGLEKLIGPLGFLSEQVDKESPNFLESGWKDQLALPALAVAYDVILPRLLQQNNPRRRLTVREEKRIP